MVAGSTFVYDPLTVIAGIPVVELGEGELMLIDGASFIYMPRREAVATRPPAFRP